MDAGSLPLVETSPAVAIGPFCLPGARLVPASTRGILCLREARGYDPARTTKLNEPACGRERP